MIIFGVRKNTIIYISTICESNVSRVTKSGVVTIIYLAVEFARLAEADFYVLTKVAELASDRWQPPRNKSKFAQNVRLGGRADK